MATQVETSLAYWRVVRLRLSGDIALQILALAIESDTMLPDETRAAIVEDLPTPCVTSGLRWTAETLHPVGTLRT